MELNRNPTPYADLNAVLADLVGNAREILGAQFVAAYLQGSFAVGDFDQHSDVDFLIAVSDDIDSELAALQALHARIYELSSPWAQHLEGSYFPLALLRRPDPQVTPLWYIDNGSRELIRSDHDNTVVVRWVVRERGITLAGAPPQQLLDPIDPADLRRDVLDTMHTWGASLLANPEQMNNRWYQSFAVISYCRMLQTLETGTVESKPAGVRWGQQALDPRWRGLIARAWAERPDPPLKIHQPADPADFEQTQRFIEYAIERGRR